MWIGEIVGEIEVGYRLDVEDWMVEPCESSEERMCERRSGELEGLQKQLEHGNLSSGQAE